MSILLNSQHKNRFRYAKRWGLVDYWPLNEGSGNALASYGGNTLTDINTVTSNFGKTYWPSRHFTRANSEYFDIADNAAVSVGDIDFWLAAWVLLDSKPAAGFLTIISKWSAGAGAFRDYLLDYDVASDRFRIVVYPDGTTATILLASTFGAASLATWYFVMAYHDSINNVLGISVNGGVFDTASYSSGVSNTASAFRIGSIDVSSTPTNCMDGRVQGACLGKPTLGFTTLAAEIRNRLYRNGNGRQFPFIR